MNKRSLANIISVSLVLTLVTSFTLPVLSVSASELDVSQNVITSKDTNFDTLSLDSNMELKGAPTQAMKAAAKWVAKNWDKVYKATPSWAKKYISANMAFGLLDKFIGISDSIEDMFHRFFRSMGVPETANWAITNVIMWLLPI